MDINFEGAVKDKEQLPHCERFSSPSRVSYELNREDVGDISYFLDCATCAVLKVSFLVMVSASCLKMECLSFHVCLMKKWIRVISKQTIIGHQYVNVLVFFLFGCHCHTLILRFNK